MSVKEKREREREGGGGEEGGDEEGGRKERGRNKHDPMRINERKQAQNFYHCSISLNQNHMTGLIA